MNYILFDSDLRYQLLPFTHTRPIADIRCGILTMRERWEHFTQTTTSTLTEEYLNQVYPIKNSNDSIFINGAVFATHTLWNKISTLKPGEQLVKGEIIIASHVADEQIHFEKGMKVNAAFTDITFEGEIKLLHRPWDIFHMNGQAIQDDYKLLTDNKEGQLTPDGVVTRNSEYIFIEEGAIIDAGVILNAVDGPIYIGKNAHIMEQAVLRGPVAICEGATVKIGAKIYGDTTIGPVCKVGGELSNVVFFAYSNKGHDGYLGNAVIGEWCNLGADTNCSNLKNNYDSIKIWDEHIFKSVKSGLTFCGLLMGDHSKCGINTMFNTGTVVGVSANIYGGDFLPKFIPSFSWGGSDGMTTYKFERALETANRMMERRGKELNEEEKDMYRHIFEFTQKQRDLFNTDKN